MEPVINFNRFNREDVMSISTSLLYSLKENPKYSTISELSYLLGYDSFIKLITYYGGMTVRIPTSSEINEMLKILLLYQYYEVEGYSWTNSLSKAGISQNDSLTYKNKLSYLKKNLKDQEFGGRQYD